MLLSTSILKKIQWNFLKIGHDHLKEFLDSLSRIDSSSYTFDST
jgi:hypothetical protein